MQVALIDKGPGINLYALVIKGKPLVREFVDGLEERDQKQVINLFNLILKEGLLSNIQKFRKVSDYIFELKTRGGIRILSFTGGNILPNSLVLTHGFNKPGKKVLRRNVNKAEAWRKDFLNGIELV
jgi:phage-related protein